jgi:hypothetical protein
VGYVSFTGDEYGGLALPLWVGGGGRARVSSGVSVGGELVVLGGPVTLGRDQGLGPFVSISVLGSVDFAL